MEEKTDIEDAEPARNTPSCCQINHSQVSPRQLLKPLARICPQIIMLGTTMTQIKPYIGPSCPRLGDSMFNHHGSAAAGVGEGDAAPHRRRMRPAGYAAACLAPPHLVIPLLFSFARQGAALRAAAGRLVACGCRATSRGSGEMQHDALCCGRPPVRSGSAGQRLACGRRAVSRVGGEMRARLCAGAAAASGVEGAAGALWPPALCSGAGVEAASAVLGFACGPPAVTRRRLACCCYQQR